VNKKRIIYIGGFEMPDGNAAAQRVMGNAKAFRDLGYDTFFIGLSSNNKCINKVSEYENFNFVNLRYPESFKDWVTHLSSIKSYKKYLVKQPDIIIAYNFPAIALNKLLKWCNRNKLPIIADCTEWYQAKGNFVFRMIKEFDIWYRMKILHPKMNGMIAISDYLYNYYSKKMNNVVNVPPLVDLSMDKWNNYEISKNDFINIVFAGSFGRGNKERFDKVIEVLSQIKNENENILFILTVVGETREKYLKIFLTDIPSNLTENICFKGRLSHTNTIKEIKKADFVLFLREDNLVNNAGFPTKFVEAIAAGTPVLTNSTSNIKDYLLIGKYGYILNSKSNTGLKMDLIEALTQTSEHIEKMKVECFHSQLFNYKNFISSFNKLICNL